MGLFGAKKPVSSLRDQLLRAKENLQHREKSPSSVVTSESSHIGQQLDMIRKENPDLEGTVTTSVIVREELGDSLGGPEVPTRDVINEVAKMHNNQAADTGWYSQIVPLVHRRSVDTIGNQRDRTPALMMISSDTGDSSELSQPPTTDYGGFDISFPQQTRQESSKYE